MQCTSPQLTAQITNVAIRRKGSCKVIMTSSCVSVQQPHKERWLAQHKYREFLTETRSTKNWNLKCSITLLTLLWSMPITLPESVCKDKKKCNKSAGYKNWFCQSLYMLGLQYEPKQTMKFWLNWIRNRHSVFSFTTRYVSTHPDGHLAYMEGPERNMQTARPYAVHTSFHEKCKLNSCLKTENNFSKNFISIKSWYWEITGWIIF